MLDKYCPKLAETKTPPRFRPVPPTTPRGRGPSGTIRLNALFVGPLFDNPGPVCGFANGFPQWTAGAAQAETSGPDPGRKSGAPQWQLHLGLPFVGHQIMWGAKELLRGVGMEAGHAPHIDVSIRFHLEAEYAHLVAFLEQ